MKEWYLEIVFLFDDIEEVLIVYNFQFFMDIVKVWLIYWKDVFEINMNINCWIGCMIIWKGFYQMFDFYEKFLKFVGKFIVMEGLECFFVFIVIKEKGILYEYYGNCEIDKMNFVLN